MGKYNYSQTESVAINKNRTLSILKIKEVLLFATKPMGLEDIVLSKGNKAQKRQILHDSMQVVSQANSETE